MKLNNQEREKLQNAFIAFKHNRAKLTLDALINLIQAIHEQGDLEKSQDLNDWLLSIPADADNHLTHDSVVTQIVNNLYQDGWKDERTFPIVTRVSYLMRNIMSIPLPAFEPDHIFIGNINEPIGRGYFRNTLLSIVKPIKLRKTGCLSY